MDYQTLLAQSLRQPRPPSAAMRGSVMLKPEEPPVQINPDLPLESVSPEDWLPNPKSLVAALKGLGTAGAVGSVASKDGLLKLFHGGRKFSEWNPKTIGSGEGMSYQALGPGLYAGDTRELAQRYLRYGGQNPALSELLVDPSTIINTRLKMPDAHREAYQRAVAELDKMGLRASSSGIPNVFLMGRSYNPQEVRQALSESGVGGLRTTLPDPWGSEFAIFDPSIIKRIRALD